MGNFFKNEILIEKNKIGLSYPTCFIADIAANHDGDLERAKDLIYKAAEAGADIAKFQHFAASTIVSDYGFKNIGEQSSHQSKWSKSVYEVYQDASLNDKWTPLLKDTCVKAGIIFMTSPYSIELVDSVDPFVNAYKIGSGDITWNEIVEHISKKNKPVLLATGASSIEDVKRAIEIISQYNSEIVLMQCNTNYTADIENFKYINLNVLKQFSELYPGIVLGLSDHTHGHSAVLGAVALGARVIEKHFTDDNDREGPDHKFAMNPKSWREMVYRTRELESSLGTGLKVVEENEKQTIILQRRAIRAKKGLVVGNILKKEDIEVLRPCPLNAIDPYDMEKVVGKVLLKNIKSGEIIRWIDIK